MDFWDRLEHVRIGNDVLAHPFYVRWSAGELTREELARYAGEYRHAVIALAQAAASAARAAKPVTLANELGAHAAEEAGHVALWDDFARAAGADLGREPLPETVACARAWAGERNRPLLESLVALYAIESAQPAISATKLRGLRTHYGLGGPTATAYFELHVERDVEHALAGRALIEERLDCSDHDSLLREAELVLNANWKLLDGVQRQV